MYKVGLSHYQTEMYLGFLMSRGFLAKQDSRICTTEKGKRFLSLLVELAEMLRGSPEHTNQVVPGTATLSESEAKKKNTTPRKSR